MLPSFSEQSAVSIRKALAAGKAEVALDGFRSTGLSAAEQLSFDELMWLGQTAASHIDYESAELAFASAAARKAPPEALGRARVMLARLLAERLNRKADAATWMKRIIAEQPGTPAATYAETWLSETK
jgi:TolA-binding protein